MMPDIVKSQPWQAGRFGEISPGCAPASLRAIGVNIPALTAKETIVIGPRAAPLFRSAIEKHNDSQRIRI
jgi:hypothetical protein